jgi:diguanylate cyclase (GGDEF)-like protein
MTTNKLEEKLRELRKLYLSTLDEKLNELVELFKGLKSSWNNQDCYQLQFNAHSLRGSGGTLGFIELSEVLQKIDVLLKPYVGNSPLDKAPIISLLSAHFVELHKAYKNIAAESSQQLSDYSAIPTTATSTAKTYSTIPATQKLSDTEIKIVVVDDDLAVGTLLTTLLSEFNFQVSHSCSLADAKTLIANDSPHIVILDLTMHGCTESDIFEYAKQLEASGTRTFALTSHNNFTMRLAAVRANVSAYIVKPAVITALVAEIREVLKLDLVKPFKVCMVDDQQAVIDYYKAALEEYQIDVRGLTEPEKLLDFIQQFDPDMFIFDLSMPRVNGIELAKLIRHKKKYDAVPIMFLSADASLDLKLDILEIGCDDLLPKNMSADLLGRQITSRINRGQRLRYLTNRDSMTGLLNHGQIIEAAQEALNLGLRHNSPVILAMLDLDFFKKVNDTYGHAAGDKVIMGLAQLLLQSIRKSDYIGRYGGEEFLLVFQNADQNSVKRKIDQIRETFSHIKFLHDSQEFQVTCSAGLACSTANSTLISVLTAADAALYQAKQNGRNRIVFAN